MTSQVKILTRFERAAIIGERARQLAYNAEPQCDVSDGITDPFAIAERELLQNVLPIQIKQKNQLVSLKDFKWICTRFS